jgi:hypothetical protein
MTIETDPHGGYEALFLQAPYAVVIRLRGREQAPFAQIVAHEPFAPETRLDFRVPANAFSVQVIDADSGEGLSGARIGVVNVWGKTPAGEDLSQVQTIEAGADGRADLPPLRPGEVRLTAEAPGYRRPEYLELPLEEDDPGREITIALEREGAGGRLRVLLPTGEPAAGAEAIVVPSLDGAVPPAWRGAADAAGWLEPPARGANQWLVVKHPAAGFLARHAPGAGDETSWSLPPAAPPLALRIVRSSEEPGSWARLALRVGEAVFSGPILQWAAGADGADASGFWRGHGLPAGPLDVVAWMPADGVARDPIALLASFGTPVADAGRSPVVIEAIE